MPVARCLLTIAAAAILAAAADPAHADTRPVRSAVSGSTAAMPGHARAGEWHRKQQLLRQLVGKQQSSQEIVRPMIVGGTEAEEGVHPFQVALVAKSFDRDDYQDQFCGGSLVAERIVVTAAHCVDFITDPGFEVQVLVKARMLDGSGERVDIKRIHVHPAYDETYLDYDVAVLELETPVTGVPFARLASRPPTTGGAVLRVTGWGTLSDLPKPESPIALQKVDVPFVPRTDDYCGDLFGITPRMLCAGNAGVDSCRGDSGGPLTINSGAGFTELVGIVSWGPVCAAPDLPGVYTNVAEYSVNAFIRSVILGQARTIQFESSVHALEGSRSAKLTITRSSGAGAATVDYWTEEYDARPNADYNAVSRTVTFQPGSLSAEITVPIVNDRRKEGWESFAVRLASRSSGWTLANNGRAWVFIEDDD